MPKRNPQPLSNFDILDMMKKDKKFVGVYSRNDSPKLKKGQSIIINLDHSESGGTHWCAMNFKDEKIEYFDSFGYPPPQEIVDQYEGMKYSSNKIQMPNSIMCGYYCVMYLKERKKNKTMYDVIYHFDVEPSERNELIVKNYFGFN